jgi:GxxExxY protein
MKYEEITHKIIGCAMKVHSTLGNGFQEVIYQRALAIEMGKQGLGFQREMEMTIFYEGIDIGTRRVDFFCGRYNNGRIKSFDKIRRSALSPSNELLSSL